MHRLLAVMLTLLPTLAHAEWRASPPGLPPRAVGEGAQAALRVSCGNGGLMAFEILNHVPGANEEIFVLGIDRNPEGLFFADCQGNTCLLDMETMERVQQFQAQLQSGSVLSVGLYRRGLLTTIPLTGSARAMRPVVQACGL